MSPTRRDLLRGPIAGGLAMPFIRPAWAARPFTW